MKKKIVVFCDFYLPGYRSGGGMWTVVNLVERFADRYDFFVITRNYDGRNDKTPYKDVVTDDWNMVGSAKVYYLADSGLTTKRFEKLLDEIRPDAVFLNSVFCKPAIKYHLLRRKKKFAHIPTILAPCGELIPATLEIKPLKKKPFLAAAKLFGLYDRVIWKASFAAEINEIQQVFGRSVTIMEAPDLPPHSVLPKFDMGSKPTKEKGHVKLIFVSRIAKKKNLAFLLERLSRITSGQIELDIVGPIEDEAYWDECLGRVAKLPNNVKVTILGPMSNAKVLDNLVKAHFFVLPTIGENFGYVFVEAMAAGCPLVISDQTVWNGLEDKNIGWNIPLDNKEEWLKTLEKCRDMDDAEYRFMASGAREFATNWLDDPAVEAATGAVLKRALVD